MWQITGLVAVALISQLGGFVQGASVTATVECGVDGDNLNITITGVDDLAEWSLVDWRVDNNADCQPTFSGTTVTYTNLDADDCASLTSNADFFMYVITIDPTKSGSSPIRAYDHSYKITCKYNRDGTVQESFVPLHKLQDNEIGQGQLVFDLSLYKESGHTTPVASDPIDLNDLVYAEIELSSEFTETLDIVIDSCYATKDQSGNNGVYNFITDSCPESHVTYTCSGQNDETEEFSFTAFRYPGQTGSDQVWVHCEVYACLKSNTTSRCRTQCNVCPSKKRKRRDAYQPVTDIKYQVTTGPFRFVDGKDAQKDAITGEQEGKPASTANLAIILSVSGVVALAIVGVVVVVVLRKRRQNVTLAGGEAHVTNMKI